LRHRFEALTDFAAPDAGALGLGDQLIEPVTLRRLRLSPARTCRQRRIVQRQSNQRQRQYLEAQWAAS
jgi:hypothetical protein